MHLPRQRRPESPEKDEVETPDHIWRPLHEEFGFVWDLAASETNTKLTGRYYDKEADALSMPVWPLGALWCNPPYSRTAEFVAGCIERAVPGHRTIVMLVPASTDTRWWHELVWDDDRGGFRPGVRARLKVPRIRFVGHKDAVRWASTVLIITGTDAASC